MKGHRSIIRATLFWVGFGSSMVATECAIAQQSRRCPPVCSPSSLQSNSRMRITYGGRIYFNFPNYGVAVSGSPMFPGQVSRYRPSNARVIVRNNQGMYWDGSGFFVHPAYRYDLVSRHYFTERTIGQLGSTSPKPNGKDLRSPSKSIPKAVSSMHIAKPHVKSTQMPPLALPRSKAKEKPKLKPPYASLKKK